MIPQQQQQQQHQRHPTEESVLSEQWQTMMVTGTYSQSEDCDYSSSSGYSDDDECQTTQSSALSTTFAPSTMLDSVLLYDHLHHNQNNTKKNNSNPNNNNNNNNNTHVLDDDCRDDYEYHHQPRQHQNSNPQQRDYHREDEDDSLDGIICTLDRLSSKDDDGSSSSSSSHHRRSSRDWTSVRGSHQKVRAFKRSVAHQVIEMEDNTNTTSATSSRTTNEILTTTTTMTEYRNDNEQRLVGNNNDTNTTSADGNDDDRRDQFPLDNYDYTSTTNHSNSSTEEKQSCSAPRKFPTQSSFDIVLSKEYDQQSQQSSRRSSGKSQQHGASNINRKELLLTVTQQTTSSSSHSRKFPEQGTLDDAFENMYDNNNNNFDRRKSLNNTNNKVEITTVQMTSVSSSSSHSPSELSAELGTFDGSKKQRHGMLNVSNQEEVSKHNVSSNSKHAQSFSRDAIPPRTPSSSHRGCPFDEHSRRNRSITTSTYDNTTNNSNNHDRYDRRESPRGDNKYSEALNAARISSKSTMETTLHATKPKLFLRNNERKYPNRSVSSDDSSRRSSNYGQGDSPTPRSSNSSKHPKAAQAATHSSPKVIIATSNAQQRSSITNASNNDYDRIDDATVNNATVYSSSSKPSKLTPSQRSSNVVNKFLERYAVDASEKNVNNPNDTSMDSSSNSYYDRRNIAHSAKNSCRQENSMSVVPKPTKNVTSTHKTSSSNHYLLHDSSLVQGGLKSQQQNLNVHKLPKRSAFDVVVPSPPVSFHHKSGNLFIDRSLMDELSPRESPSSLDNTETMNKMDVIKSRVARRFSSDSLDKYSKKSAELSSTRKSAMKQLAPSPSSRQIKVHRIDGTNLLGKVFPSSCGESIKNGKDPVERVIDLFDTPGRTSSYSIVNNNGATPVRAVTHSTQRSNNNQRSFNSSGAPSTLRTVYTVSEPQHNNTSHASRSENEQVTLLQSENSQLASVATNTDKSEFPKTESQKRHELEILRGLYQGWTDEPIRGGSTSRKPNISTKVSSESSSTATDANESDIHDAIWGSDSSESCHRRSRHSTGRIDNKKSIGGRTPSHSRASNSPVARTQPHHDRSKKVSTANPSPFQTIDVLFDQLTRCQQLQHDSPPKQSGLFSVPHASKGKNGNTLPVSPALNHAFRSGGVHRQISGISKIDASRFPTENIATALTSGYKGNTSNDDINLQQSDEEASNREDPSIDKFSDRKMNISGKCIDNVFGDATGKTKIRIKNHDLSAFVPATSPIINANALKATPSSSPALAIVTYNDNEREHYMYVAYSRFGENAQNVIQLCEHHSIPNPSHRKNEVLIRVHASTISNSDCAIRRGEWPNISMDPYIIPGVALVGSIVTESGKKKSRASFSFSSPIQPGDIVLALVMTGGNARYSCVAKNQLVKVPPQINPELAVCLTETYLTAFQILHLGHKGSMRYRENSLNGESVLIMGGYSPLGKAIIELCRAGGAEFCYALTNPEQSQTTKKNRREPGLSFQYDAIKKWGGIPLSNDPQDWLTLIGRQIDTFITVYDPFDSARCNECISGEHWKALRKDGNVIIVCSYPGMNIEEQRENVFGSDPNNNNGGGRENGIAKSFRIPSCRLSGREKLADRAIWYNLFDSRGNERGGRSTTKKDLEHLLHLLHLDLVQPEIANRYPLSRVSKAQALLERKKKVRTVGHATGHLICSPWLVEQKTKRGGKIKSHINDHFEC